MDKSYIERRRGKNYTAYRLGKRTNAIAESLKECVNIDKNSMQDIGTADGQMVNDIARRFDLKRVIGIDNSEDAVKAASLNGVKTALADFRNLPFKNDTFDIVVASAVVEHIENAEFALQETHRVLKERGVLCITLPNPAYDWINSRLVKTYHVRRYSLKGIVKILGSNGFEVAKAGYFMFWPFGNMPFDKYPERFLKFLKLDFLLFNHVTITRKI